MKSIVHRSRIWVRDVRIIMFSMIFKEFFSKLAEIDKNIIKCQKSIRWNYENSFSAQKYLSFETKRSFLALLVQEISIFKDYFSVNLFRKMAFFMKMACFFRCKKWTKLWIGNFQSLILQNRLLLSFRICFDNFFVILGCWDKSFS